MGEKYTEITFNPEGIGATLYEKIDGQHIVCDETWLTTAEIDELLEEGRSSIVLEE